MYKKMRHGFSMIGLIIAIAAMGAIGTVAGPSIITYIDRTKVDDLITKEQILKDAFVNYYRASDYNISNMPQNIDQLISVAISDKLLPKTDSSSTSVTATDIAYYKSNGFGGNIALSLSGAILNIESDIPSSKPYARRYYQNATGKLYPGYSGTGNILGHQYALAGDMMKHVQLTTAIAEKAATAGATTDEAAAKTSSTKWWDYNPANDVYQVKNWNGTGWEVEKTVYANNGTTASSGGSLLTTVGDPNSVSAASVAEGTIMTDSNGRQYASVGGGWKPIGNSSMVGDINGTSASSVSNGTTISQLNTDGSVSQYISINGAWYQVSSGGSSGGAFIEPSFTLPLTIYPKGVYDINSSHPSPLLVSGYQWEVVSNNFSLSTLVGSSTTMTLATADVGDTLILKMRAVSTAGIASAWITKSATIGLPAATITASSTSEVIGRTVNLGSNTKAVDNSAITVDSYLWSVSSGTLSSTTVSNPVLTLPLTPSTVTVTLTTTYKGISKSSTTSIAAIDMTAPTLAGVSASYNGAIEPVSVSNTTNYIAPTYLWSIVSGGGTLSSTTVSNPTYTLATTGTAATVRCTVTDNGISKSTDLVFAMSAMVSPVITGSTTPYDGQTTAYATATSHLTGTTYAWTKFSGTPTVAFSASTAKTTNATFTGAGAVTLRLTATYKGKAVYTDYAVTSSTMATPTLSGTTTTYQGAAEPLAATNTTSYVAPTYLWSIVSGGGTLSSTTVSNPTYTLATTGTAATVRCTVTDNGISKSTDLVFAMSAMVSPVVTGSTAVNLSIATAYSTSTSYLAGTTYLWVKVSGTPTVTFSASTSASTNATFATDSGNITIRLTATYKGKVVYADLIVGVKPQKPTITLPAAVYYTEAGASFSAAANGATGTTFTFTFVNGTTGTQTTNTILWTAPTMGTATVKVKQVKDGVSSDEDGPYNINLVTMNTPVISNNHYSTDLVSSPQFYYLNTLASTAGANSLVGTFTTQGTGTPTYSWANYTGDESDITYATATALTTAYTCGVAGIANIGIVVTHRGVSKTTTTDIECNGFETMEY